MFLDKTIFNEPEPRNENINIRLTKAQKDRISQMAGGESISVFILSLLAEENTRRIEAECVGFFDYVDTSPDYDLPPDDEYIPY